MNLNKNLLANFFALTTIVLWLFCSLFVWLLPQVSLTITKWWMHGMPLESYQIGLQNFFMGGITITGTAWITGYVLGWSINLLDRK